MIYLITGQQSLYDYHPKATLEDCIEYVKTKEVLGLDIETTRLYNKYLDIEGLDPYTSDIVMLQIGDLERQYIIDTRTIDITSLLPVLVNPDIVLVGHNIKFEYKHILSKYGIRINNLYDTMIAEKILHNGYFLENSLKNLNYRYFNIEVDKTIRLGFLTIKDRPFTLREIEYGAEDVIYPLRIREIQLEEGRKKDLLPTFRLEFRFTAVLGEMEYNGISFNKQRWKDTYQKNLEKFTKLTKQLDDFILDNYSDTDFVNKQLDLFNPGFTCNIKWTSSKQVIKFFRHLGCCPQAVSKTTKKLTYTVEAKEVANILVTETLPIKIREFIKLYLSTKEMEQAVTTFGIKFFKYINPITKRVHSNYNQIVNTGRMSSRSPNNQNIPAKHEFRYAFDAPEGKTIVNADYSGQENIVLANKAMDKDILEFYDQGLSDMHSFIAKKLFPTELADIELKDVKKKRADLRQIAKAAGFALAYGGNGHTISKNLGLPLSRGEAVYDSYFKAFPGLHKFFEKTKATALRDGYILIDSISKRKFYFKDHKRLKACEYSGDFKSANKLRGKMERAAMNYIIQGESGSITKYAAILLYDWVTEQNLFEDIKLVLMVHDEINLEVSNSLVDQASKKLEESMENAGALWCKRVPLKATAVQSDYWTH